MVLLTFAALAIAGAAIKGATKDVVKASADNKIRREGYNIFHFEDVLKACHVTRKKQDGMKYLPEDGWKNCIHYIESQPYTTQKDIDNFINRYERVRKQEISNIENIWKRNYNRVYDELQNSTAPATKVVFEKTHYLFDDDFVKSLVDDLYNKTMMGEFALQKPKVVFNPNATNISFKEIWVLKIPGGKTQAKKCWKVSSRYLGYPID